MFLAMIIGNVGNDIQIRGEYANFSIANNVTTREGQRTDWINVSVHNTSPLYKFVTGVTKNNTPNIHKGTRLVVVGTYSDGMYTTGQGQTAISRDLRPYMINYDSMGTGNGNQQNGQGQNQAQGQNYQNQNQQNGYQAAPAQQNYGQPAQNNYNPQNQQNGYQAAPAQQNYGQPAQNNYNPQNQQNGYQAAPAQQNYGQPAQDGYNPQNQQGTGFLNFGDGLGAGFADVDPNDMGGLPFNS